MKVEKKYIIAGVLGVVSIALALGYLQYKKLMNYVIGYKGMKVKKLSADQVVLDLFLNFTNKSDLKFEIIEQDYKVYLNNQFVTQLANYSKNTIMPKATSVIGINVAFNPKQVLNTLGQNWFTIISNPAKIAIKMEIKLKVSLWGIKVSIPYVYEDTLKGIVDAYKQPSV